MRLLGLLIIMAAFMLVGCNSLVEQQTEAGCGFLPWQWSASTPQSGAIINLTNLSPPDTPVGFNAVRVETTVSTEALYLDLSGTGRNVTDMNRFWFLVRCASGTTVGWQQLDFTFVDGLGREFHFQPANSGSLFNRDGVEWDRVNIPIKQTVSDNIWYLTGNSGFDWGDVRSVTFVMDTWDTAFVMEIDSPVFDVDVSPCEWNVTCLNGGILQGNTFLCSCTPAYMGYNCSECNTVNGYRLINGKCQPSPDPGSCGLLYSAADWNWNTESSSNYTVKYLDQVSSTPIGFRSLEVATGGGVSTLTISLSLTHYNSFNAGLYNNFDFYYRTNNGDGGWAGFSMRFIDASMTSVQYSTTGDIIYWDGSWQLFSFPIGVINVTGWSRNLNWAYNRFSWTTLQKVELIFTSKGIQPFDVALDAPWFETLQDPCRWACMNPGTVVNSTLDCLCDSRYGYEQTLNACSYRGPCEKLYSESDWQWETLGSVISNVSLTQGNEAPVNFRSIQILSSDSNEHTVSLRLPANSSGIDFSNYVKFWFLLKLNSTNGFGIKDFKLSFVDGSGSEANYSRIDPPLITDGMTWNRFEVSVNAAPTTGYFIETSGSFTWTSINAIAFHTTPNGTGFRMNIDSPVLLLQNESCTWPNRTLFCLNGGILNSDTFVCSCLIGSSGFYCEVCDSGYISFNQSCVSLPSPLATPVVTSNCGFGILCDSSGQILLNSSSVSLTSNSTVFSVSVNSSALVVSSNVLLVVQSNLSVNANSSFVAESSSNITIQGNLIVNGASFTVNEGANLTVNGCLEFSNSNLTLRTNKTQNSDVNVKEAVPVIYLSNSSCSQLSIPQFDIDSPNAEVCHKEQRWAQGALIAFFDVGSKCHNDSVAPCPFGNPPEGFSCLGYGALILVIPGIVVLAGICVAIIFGVKRFRQRVLPFKDRKNYFSDQTELA